jgi:hypothetical protein
MSLAAMSLAPYACDPALSRGRRHAEPPAPTRDAFQRDRDRIVHSTAFRRLVYKTQVFLNHEGDLFRTRLTHSLEVAQLGRSIARALQLNEDLVEAIALAHDLGHTPFGHAGQDALNACMADHGGFEHNLQSLRVVDALEHRYPQYDGLNLSFETREGILKHCSRANAERIEAAEPGGVARRFLDRTQPGLEAQLCNLADAIAYNAHDIDDGVRSGLISVEQLADVELFERYRREALAEYPAAAGPPRALRDHPAHAERPGLRRDRRHARGAGSPGAGRCRRSAPRPAWSSPSAEDHAGAVGRAQAFSCFATSTATRRSRRPPTRRSRWCASCSRPTSNAVPKCPIPMPSATTGTAPWPTTSPA